MAGRPTKLNSELADDICRVTAANVKGLKRLCEENPSWPCFQTIRRWLRDNQTFRDQYAQAKEDQTHLMAEEIIEIADDTSRDTLLRTNKNGEDYEVANNEWINRSRLRVDARKWLASKLLPKIYGDKTIQESKVSVSYEDALKELE